MKKNLNLFTTNIVIMFVLSITMSVLGVGPYINAKGLDLGNLLTFAAIMVFGETFILLAKSKWSSKRKPGTVVIVDATTPTEIWLMKTVRQQADMVGITMPEVAILDSPKVSAFATGMTKNRSLVVVSTGLLKAMSRDEAEAVLAHEISHVSNGDRVTSALVFSVVNTFVIFFSHVIGYAVDIIFNTEKGSGPAFFITMIIAQYFISRLAIMIVMWFSRQSEFRADADGAKLCSAKKVVAALERLQALYEPSALPKQMAAIGISEDGSGEMRRLYSSHPGLDERIAALRTQ